MQRRGKHSISQTHIANYPVHRGTAETRLENCRGQTFLPQVAFMLRAGMIARLDLAAIDDLREALPRFAHVPLAHLHHLNSEQRRAYWLDEISQSLAKESSIAFQWVASGTIKGFIVYNDSPWDSEITGRRIGTVEHIAVAAGDDSGTEILQELLDELTRSLADRETQCVVCKVHSNELPAIHALEQRGFLLMDTLLDFVFDFSRTPTRRNQSSETRQTIEDSSGETSGPVSAHGDK